MKTFENTAAQGDLLIRRIDNLPDNATKTEAKNGKHVLAHSETGHHHTVLERSGVTLYQTDDPFRGFLEVFCGGVNLIHERPFDTHESLHIPAGIFELRRQREYTAKGFRKVQD